MVPNAWINSNQIEFWPPQLHQHLHPHATSPKQQNLSTNSRFALALISTLWQPVLVTGFKQPLQINDYHFAHATLYTTFPVYPLLTTSTLYWITTNTSTTDTTWPSCILNLRTLSSFLLLLQQPPHSTTKFPYVCMDLLTIHTSCAVSIIISFICCQCSFTSRYFYFASSTLPQTMLLNSSRLPLELPYSHSWLELLMPSFCCIKLHVHY